MRLYPMMWVPTWTPREMGLPTTEASRGSSEVVASRIREEIQTKVEEAGLVIVEARITYLAYAPEIGGGHAVETAGICYH